MEDKNSFEMPMNCTAGCGFYGNKAYNNMCSKCFKDTELKQDIQKDLNQKVNKSVEIIQTKETVTKEETTKITETKEPEKPIIEEVVKVVQKNKGKCWSCKTKIPLAKQLTNKCKCEFVFCDSHRFPDKHTCEFDHAQKDKDVLAKNNPKLNEKPRGGNSFNRV